MFKQITKLYNYWKWKRSTNISSNGQIFNRRFVEIIEIGSNWYIEPRYIFPVYDYFCPQCQSKLEDGPSGGTSVNSVCNKCKRNYGCLPNRNDKSGTP